MVVKIDEKMALYGGKLVYTINYIDADKNEEVFQHNRRDINVDDEFITSGANSISSPINELFNWFKNKYYFIFNQVKEPHTHTILEPSFSFNNGLWSWVWNKLSNLSFKLLPEADATTLDNSKSFNDIYKLIKQFNNHPSDTQIGKQNHKTEAENNNIDNNESYNLYYNDIDNSKSSLSDYLLKDDPGNEQGNLQTVINSIDIPSNLSLLTLLIGQFFGTNKALSNNPYISPEQEKNRYINELNKTVKSVISKMETKYGKRQITNKELEDILPSLAILFNGQKELDYNNYSTSVLGKITEICNHVYDFFGYEAN